MKTIDRQACQIIREVLDANLPDLVKDMGLIVEVKNASFNEAAVTFKVQFTAPDAAAAKDREEWMLYAKFNGDVEAEWFGGTIKRHGADDLQIVGYNSRSPKNCIVLSGLRKCSPGYIRQEIKRGNFVPAGDKE